MPTALLLLDYFYRTMVVAVITMRVVQMTIDQVIDVIAMRNGLMAATGTVNVARVVAPAGMVWRALIRIRSVHFNPMFFDATILTHVM